MDSNDQQSLPSIKSVEDFIAREYDYVIVGGGTAGLVLAARLTEHPNTTVGVIEAGIPRFGDPLVDTPALFSQMFGRSDYDWNFKSVPQVSVGLQRATVRTYFSSKSANKNKIHHMPRGKMLGGSSGINFMV